MTVGDYTVRFNVDEFGIKVMKEEVDEELGEGADDEERKEYARRVAMQRFYEVVTESSMPVKTDVAETVYEGTRW